MTILVWPAAVVIIAVVFMAIFKKPLERLLDRTKKIGSTGLDATASAQETSIDRRPTGADELLAQFEDEFLVDQEGLIRQELDHRRIDNPAERERVLTRLLAGAYIHSRFERTYHLIFGSQLSVLQELNAMGTAHRNNGREVYAVATVLSPDFYANYSFDQWLNFMVSQVLVRVDDGDAVSITVAGREFLKFVVQQGLSFNKTG
jgi:hypothetical protein